MRALLVLFALLSSNTSWAAKVEYLPPSYDFGNVLFDTNEDVNAPKNPLLLENEETQKKENLKARIQDSQERTLDFLRRFSEPEGIQGESPDDATVVKWKFTY